MENAKILYKRYIELEKVLNLFCKNFDYCYPFCIKKELETSEIAVGCCKNKYYKKYDLDILSYEILKTEREKIYGPPSNYEHIKTLSPCEYHSPSGCVLKTHKSPVCNAFFCPESIEFLRKKYNIFNCDYLGIYYGLEWTLDGTFSEKQYLEFKTELIEMNKKISGKALYLE
ncbi:MAG: hypothetical protein RBR53_11175 [Desulforegulaceae bacterium]|nr:hypothetical protein [Desulforegulaceae bacterium]